MPHKTNQIPFKKSTIAMTTRDDDGGGGPSSNVVTTNVKRYLINYPHLSDYGQTIFFISFPSSNRATAPGRYEQFYFTEHVPYPQK